MPPPPSAELILNLGSGTRTSPEAVNVDWSIHQRLRASRTGRVAAALVLRGERRHRFDAMSGEVLVHDLRRGVPFDTGTVEAVYHSHTLEHIDRSDVPGFLAEILRVLKPGGIHRIVVPDLERAVRGYLRDLDAGGREHDRTLAPIFEQMVRREPHGTSLQPPLRRRAENLLLGDARRRGETHQWMYDHLNLRQALEKSGHVDVRRVDADTSAIPGWDRIALDRNADGSLYKPGSLFMEARKPGRAAPGQDAEQEPERQLEIPIQHRASSY
jgi:SAM-dependent methyltransferase